eukprot:scaffold7303_cov153-Amphora_coffeaeformis.AAC.1
MASEEENRVYNNRAEGITPSSELVAKEKTMRNRASTSRTVVDGDGETPLPHKDSKQPPNGEAVLMEENPMQDESDFVAQKEVPHTSKSSSNGSQTVANTTPPTLQEDEQQQH